MHLYVSIGLFSSKRQTQRITQLNQIHIMKTIKAHANQIAQNLILENGELQIQLIKCVGGYVLAESAERCFWDEETGDEVITKVDVREALDELTMCFHKGNCYQPHGSIAADVDGEWYTIIYKADGGYKGIQIA